MAVAGVALPGSAAAQSSGGAEYVPPPPPAKRAKIAGGQAVAPLGAPARVKRAIEHANMIVGKPYVYGGGHKPYSLAKSSQTPLLDKGYDCSGTISMALFGGKFLRNPLDSSSFMSWGAAGEGQRITVYANPGHAFMVVDGRRFDTSGMSAAGTRWQSESRSTSGYVARHPPGL